MTDGWPTMPPMGGGWVWAVLIGPVESVGEKRGVLENKAQKHYVELSGKILHT